jgi:hypothetical protein
VADLPPFSPAIVQDGRYKRKDGLKDLAKAVGKAQ